MIISPNFLNSVAKENNITEYSQESILLENRNYFLESGDSYDIFWRRILRDLSRFHAA